MLCSAYDDLSIRYELSWKEHRATRKTADSTIAEFMALLSGFGEASGAHCNGQMDLPEAKRRVDGTHKPPDFSTWTQKLTLIPPDSL